MPGFGAHEGHVAGRPVTLGPHHQGLAAPRGPQVVDPSREGGVSGDLLLVDSETQTETEVTVTPELLRIYKERLDRLCGSLRAYCTRRDLVHLVVETSTPVETLMLEYLRRRGMLR